MKLHIEYLRSLEDSDRTRAACVFYINTWLQEFYPYRPDIAQQLKEMAADLGGKEKTRKLSWKYNWLVRLFGWGVGRRANLMLPRNQETAIIAWDKAMYQRELRSQTAGRQSIRTL